MSVSFYKSFHSSFLSHFSSPLFFLPSNITPFHCSTRRVLYVSEGITSVLADCIANQHTCLISPSDVLILNTISSFPHFLFRKKKKPPSALMCTHSTSRPTMAQSSSTCGTLQARRSLAGSVTVTTSRVNARSSCLM